MPQPAEPEAIRAGVTASGRGLPAGEALRPSDLNGRSDDSFWQKLLGAASVAERLDCLAAVDSAGVVYAHRLTGKGEPVRHWLADVLNGRLDALHALPSEPADPISGCDRELDDAQREAVAGALRSPDLYLIQGAPGTGKSRVLAELITQEVWRGGRVLFLSPGRAALDVVLERLAGRERLIPVRCLGPHETAAKLPPVVRSLVYGEWLTRLATEPGKRCEAQRHALSEQRATAKRAREPLGPLSAVARDWEAGEAARLALEEKKRQVAGQVDAEATGTRAGTPVGAALEAEQSRHHESAAALGAELEKTESECQARAKEQQQWLARHVRQQRILDAKSHGRIFQFAYWIALFQGRGQERLEEFAARVSEAENALSAARGLREEAESRCRQEDQRHQTAVEQIRQTEISRRQSEIDHQLGELSRKQDDLSHEWSRFAADLRGACELSARPASESAQTAHHALDEALRRIEGQLAFNERWQQSLVELAPRLPALFPRTVNVVAAGTADLAQDAHFGDRAAAPILYDLVVIDQADRVAEAELLQHARRGLRCVLAGQPALAESARSDAEEKSRPQFRPSTPFHRLWFTLHSDPRRLPYQWLEDSARLTCRLNPGALEAPARCESEHLVDHPAVELRIASRPQTRPVLAEVLFPVPEFSIASAKAYLYQNLGELTLRPGAPALRWRREADRLVLETGGSESRGDRAERIELEAGVWETVQANRVDPSSNGQAMRAWETTRLEFDCGRGWDRARAEAWLRERAGVVSLQRTALLDVAWRSCLELARLGSRIFGEPSRKSGAPTASTPVLDELSVPLHFLAVPYQRERPRLRTRGPQRPAPPPAKAFEIDLADPKQRQRLPLDVQLKLPPKGIVNFAEAQAIVHLLDELVHVPSQNGEPVRVAVLSWQGPQVQFVESLWAKSADAKQGAHVVFDTPLAYRDREADVVFLSLCRSSAQRPVGYTDYPEEWRWVFGAARRQLVIVGDAETLARRATWNGPVSRQSEFAALLERSVAQTLLKGLNAGPASAAPPPGVRV